MEKRYFFIISISLILIIASIYFLIQIENDNYGNFINYEEYQVISGEKEELVTLGEFLKTIISENIKNIDYDLIKSEIRHTYAPYLKVAENYGLIEKETVTSEMLDEPIMILTAKRICELCEVNIFHHEKKSEFDEEKNEVEIEDDFLSQKEFEKLLALFNNN